MNANDPRWCVLLGGGISSGSPVPGKYGVFLSSSDVGISSAMVMSGASLGQNMEQYVYRRGSAVNTTVAASGWMIVNSRGTAVSALVSSGQLDVNAGGRAEAVSMVSAGYLSVSSGGTILSADVDGGTFYGESGGFISGLRFSDGVCSVYRASMYDLDMSGGVASFSYVSDCSGIRISSGTVNIYRSIVSGLYTDWIKVDSYGYVSVTASETTLVQPVMHGGTLVANLCDVSSAVISGGSFFLSGASAMGQKYGTVTGGLTVSLGSATFVGAYPDEITAVGVSHYDGSYSPAEIYVTGGIVGHAVTHQGGKVVLSGGAVVSSSFVSGGGNISALSGCACFNISGSGGAVLGEGAVFSHVRLERTALYTYSTDAADIVMNGGTMRGHGSNVLLLNGAWFNADNASGVTALSGAGVTESSGECRGFVAESGASMYVYAWSNWTSGTSGSGVMYEPVLSSGAEGFVYSSGAVFSPIVRSGAVLHVTSWGSAVKIILESGGSVLADSSGVTVSYRTTSSDTRVSTSEAVPGGYILSSGSGMSLISGGFVSGLQICSGAVLTVSSGGYASATHVSAAAVLSVGSGGAADDVVLDYGGVLIQDPGASVTILSSAALPQIDM